MKDGQSVGQAPHDTVDRGEFAHAVSCGEDRRPADACIAVGGIRGVQFIRTDNPFESRDIFGCVVDREGVIPGNPENLVDPKLGESGEYVFCKGLM
jgi:hypothetical protein